MVEGQAAQVVQEPQEPQGRPQEALEVREVLQPLAALGELQEALEAAVVLPLQVAQHWSQGCTRSLTMLGAPPTVPVVVLAALQACLQEPDANQQ